MKIALVQFRSKPGEVEVNTTRHQLWIRKARKAGADFVVFPELSITGYEPELAAELALRPDDQLWASWQAFCEEQQTAFALGMPIRRPSGVEIGLVLFQPNQGHRIYSKQYLHQDELPYFIAGQDWDGYWEDQNLAFAICYELSIPDHAERAHQSKANLYLASVAKFESGIASAHERLSTIARRYQMTTLMVNALGEADGGWCVGQSAIWSNGGQLIAQLDAQEEAILLYDTSTGRSEVVLS